MQKETFQNEDKSDVISSFCMDYRIESTKSKGSSNFSDKNLYKKHNKTPKKKRTVKSEDMLLKSFENHEKIKEIPCDKSDYEKYIESKKKELIYNAKPTPQVIDEKDIKNENHINLVKETDNLNFESGIDVQKKTHKFFAMFLILALIVSVGIFVSSFKKEEVFINTFEYDQFIMPVVMQDMSPFTEVNEIDKDKAVNCAIWHILMNTKDDNDIMYDDNGLRVLNLDQIIESSQHLFGSNYNLGPEEIKNSPLFTFDSESKSFHIALLSNRNSFLPYTEKAEINNDSVILSVSYIAPDDPYRCKEDGEVETPTPSKKMKYIIKNDDKTKKSYISQIDEI